MSYDYRTISVRSETFERLREEKPDGITWTRWLEEQCGVTTDE